MSTVNVPSVYIIMRQNDKLAFLLRSQTGYKDNTYTLPAGHVEEGESYRTAAIRETLEETGVRVASQNLHHAYTLQRYEERNGDIRVDIFFETTKWEGEPTNMEFPKHGELVWFPADNLPYDKIMDYQGDVLQAIARGEVYAERGWEEDE